VDQYRRQQAAAKLRTPAVLVAVAATVFGAGAYSVHEHSLAQSANAENAAMVASLKSTNAQVEQLTAKLNEMSAPKSAAVTAAAHKAAKPTAHAHQAKTLRHPVDDPRWKKVQSQLDDQGKAIDSTRQDLTAAKTELGDSIARTHGELVVPQRKGERNYYEFNIDRSKTFKSLGPIGVRLRKVNEKHQYADLELMVDDRSVTKKHVNIYEPAMFYTSDSDVPVQVVINSISKNHIHGYVSEPKYRPSQLTAQAQPADGPQASGVIPEKPRQKLSVPK
jgi:flagellar capping protein FliD